MTKHANVDWAEAKHGLMSAAVRDAFLMRGVLSLAPEVRCKLLMFLHLAEQAENIAGDATIKDDGSVELRLTYQAH